MSYKLVQAIGGNYRADQINPRQHPILVIRNYMPLGAAKLDEVITTVYCRVLKYLL